MDRFYSGDAWYFNYVLLLLLPICEETLYAVEAPPASLYIYDDLQNVAFNMLVIVKIDNKADFQLVGHH